ncbi:NUDIX hydrolase [Spiractinospora alimapuensis]|nr:NUDIX hydrolase [Spiractinospora alimapuensis]
MPGSDGDELVTRERVEHPGSVAVVAVDDRDRVLMLRQYRHAVGRQLWEIPAGLRDKAGEPPLATARRELLEEASYEARRWDTLVDLYTTPGSSNERVRIFLARDLREVPASEVDFERVHEEADMPLAWVPLPQAVAAVLSGDVHNALAQVGVLAASAAHGDAFGGLRSADAPEE